MKDIIKGILEEYASNEANLHSETLREKLTEDIIKALEHDSWDLSIKDTRQYIGVGNSKQQAELNAATNLLKANNIY